VSVPVPRDALLLERENERLELATPRERLAFAVEAFSEVAPHLPVVFVDTGFLFPETLAYRDDLAKRLGLAVRVVRPDIPNADFVARYGSDIQRRDPDLCCGLNKVAPLAALRAKARAWVSGLRRDQSRARADLAILEHDAHLVRVHPLATLTKGDVSSYLAEHGIPEHPLVQRRYLSIGCAPCTRAVADGEDERAGRWAWTSKTECGLHARPSAPPPEAPLQGRTPEAEPR
jgi:phosphoadenosine phosphosulfate reductase